VHSITPTAGAGTNSPRWQATQSPRVVFARKAPGGGGSASSRCRRRTFPIPSRRVSSSFPCVPARWFSSAPRALRHRLLLTASSARSGGAFLVGARSNRNDDPEQPECANGDDCKRYGKQRFDNANRASPVDVNGFLRKRRMPATRLVDIKTGSDTSPKPVPPRRPIPLLVHTDNIGSPSASTRCLRVPSCTHGRRRSGRRLPNAR